MKKRQFGAVIFAALLGMSVSPPASAISTVSLSDNAELSVAQQESLLATWADVSADEKFICTALVPSDPTMTESISGRRKALEVCEYLNSKLSNDYWVQTKETAALGFIGRVYVRTVTPAPKTVASSESDSITASMTVTLPKTDFTSSTASDEIMKAAEAKSANFNEASEVICTAIITEDSSDSDRENALAQATALCEQLPESVGKTRRAQVKVTKVRSVAQRILLTGTWMPAGADSDESVDQAPADTPASESDEVQVPATPTPPQGRPVSGGGGSAPVEQVQPDPEPELVTETPVAPGVPTLSIAGSLVIGTRVTATVLNVSESATLTCKWHDNKVYLTVYSSACSFVPQTAGGLYLDITARVGNSAVFSLSKQYVGKVEPPAMLNTPTLTIEGEKYVGERLVVNVGTIDPEATVTCTWDSLGSYSNTHYSSMCFFDLSSAYSSGTLNVKVTVTRTGFKTWTSGYVNIGAVTKRTFSPMPTLSLVGEQMAGETLQAVVENLPEGATMTCEWGRSGYNGWYQIASGCDLTLTSAHSDLTALVRITKPNYNSVSLAAVTGTIKQHTFTPTLSIDGDIVVGNTVSLLVSGIPEDASVSCEWARANPSGSNSTATVYSSTCQLTLTDGVRTSANYNFANLGGLYVRVRINKTNYYQWSGGISGMTVAAAP